MTIRATRSAVVALVALIAVANLTADEPSPVTVDLQQRTEERSPVVFRSVASLKPRMFGRKDQIGILVDGDADATLSQESFPASFWTFPYCSATLVGDRVLISAGHCFASNQAVAIELPNGQPASGACDVYLEGRENQWTRDLALCLLDDKVTGITFETVANSGEQVLVSDSILLTGFGGNRLVAFGTFLVGDSTVTSVSNHIATTVGDAWTTPGDSGGGVFGRFLGRRRIVAVNSTVESQRQKSHASLLTGYNEIINAWLAKKTAQLHEQIWMCGRQSVRSCRD